MQLTFWMGVFWLLLAAIGGETIVHTVRALRRGGRAAADPVLEGRIAELEAAIATLTDAHQVQVRDFAQLREQLEFAERLAARATEPALPKSTPSSQ